MPPDGTCAFALTSWESSAVGAALLEMKRTRGWLFTTRHTIPLVVADIRVKPPMPSITRIRDVGAGFCR